MPQCYLCGAAIASGRENIRWIDTASGVRRPKIVCRDCAKAVRMGREAITRVVLVVGVIAVFVGLLFYVLHQMTAIYR